MNDPGSPMEGVQLAGFRPMNLVAGVIFLILAIQVLFPKTPIPIAGVFISALGMVDFIIHEMGHFVFGFDGEFLAVMGGTLAQLFLPSICLLLTTRRKQWFLVSLFLVWLGQSFLQISMYVADARAQQLKLFSPGAVLGASEPIHDWHYMLDKTGLLWADQLLGGLIYIIGLIFLVTAVGLMFARAFKISIRWNQ